MNGLPLPVQGPLSGPSVSSVLDKSLTPMPYVMMQSHPVVHAVVLQADLARARSASEAAREEASALRVEADSLRKALRAMEGRLSEYQAKDTEVRAAAFGLWWCVLKDASPPLFPPTRCTCT